MATGQLRLNHQLKSRSPQKGDEFTTIWQQQNLSAPICKPEEISPAVHNQCIYTQFTAITLAQHFCKGFASKLTGLWQSVFKSKLPATAVSVPVPRNYFLSYLWGNPFYFLLTGSFLPCPALSGWEMPISHYPQEGFSVHTEPWQAMLQNTLLEGILTSPATWYSSETGYMNIVCHCAQTLPWCTVSALLIWTTSIVSVLYILYQNKIQHMYVFDKQKNKSLVFTSQKHEGFSVCEFWSGLIRSRTCSKTCSRQVVLSPGKLHS